MKDILLHSSSMYDYILHHNKYDSQYIYIHRVAKDRDDGWINGSISIREMDKTLYEYSDWRTDYDIAIEKAQKYLILM